jgi:hypothetical protein
MLMDKIKLNQFIEEEVDIPSLVPTINEKENRVEFKQGVVKGTQKTFYASSTPSRIICSDHRYIPANMGKYQFSCIKCAWTRVAPPNKFRYDPETKILTTRDTGIKV